MSSSSSSSLPLPLSSSSAAAVALVVGISLALESSRSSSSPSNGTSVATQATGHGPRATCNGIWLPQFVLATIFLLSLPSLCCRRRRRRRCLLLLRRCCCCFLVAAAALSTSLPGNGKSTPASGAVSAKQPAHTSCTLRTHGWQGVLPEFPLQSTFAQYGACACACARVLEQHSRQHPLLRYC